MEQPEEECKQRESAPQIEVYGPDAITFPQLQESKDFLE